MKDKFMAPRPTTGGVADGADGDCAAGCAAKIGSDAFSVDDL